MKKQIKKSTRKKETVKVPFGTNSYSDSSDFNGLEEAFGTARMVRQLLREDYNEIISMVDALKIANSCRTATALTNEMGDTVLDALYEIVGQLKE